MDSVEQLAQAHLQAQGCSNIAYEPDGNVPPDFLVDGRIAVEVRRLNQHVWSGNDAEGLDSADIRLQQKLREILDDLGPPPSGGGKWYLIYRFRRPLKRLKAIERDVRDLLRSVRSEIAPVDVQRHLPSGLEVKLFAAEYDAPNQFRLGMIVDEDSGGWLLELMERNIEHCVAEKTRKIAPYRHKYAVWWLVLLDFVGLGLDDFERGLFRDRVSIHHSWDRVVVVDPRDPTRFF